MVKSTKEVEDWVMGNRGDASFWWPSSGKTEYVVIHTSTITRPHREILILKAPPSSRGISAEDVKKFERENPDWVIDLPSYTYDIATSARVSEALFFRRQ